MSNLLSSNQVDQYNQEGYLLMSGLIPNSISVKAEQEMWRCSDVKADEPETWTNGTIAANYLNDDIVACTPMNLLPLLPNWQATIPQRTVNQKRHTRSMSFPARESGVGRSHILITR